MKIVVLIVATTLLFFSLGLTPSTQTSGGDSHLSWVTSSLKDMESIQVGMTREQLLTVFTTEGGISTPTQRRYVYKGCPLFKVDVEFQTRKDASGRVVESPDDVITKISKPFIERGITD